MPNYQFFARTEDAHTENLGTMQLRDDANARSFGAGIIRGLMHSHPAVYGRWTLVVVEDNRAVANIPFAQGASGWDPLAGAFPPR
jgi:hypothetical protein